MPRGDDWSPDEVSAAVDDYMALLLRELCGQPTRKREAARALQPRLHGRSLASIEFKRQNISAVLQAHDLYWISGYKPRGHFQHILAEAVEAWVARHPDFDRVSREVASATAVEHQDVDPTGFVVAPPKPRSSRFGPVNEEGAPVRRPSLLRDYLGIEARNRSLGRAGELQVVRFEQERLSRAGYERLAGKVDHVAASRGDGLGYDILSFETDGRERLIEVKTTNRGAETPFFASDHEVKVSRLERHRYHVYRLFDFKQRPRCYILEGAIDENCILNPASFRCSVIE